jgi:hypothetical protein
MMPKPPLLLLAVCLAVGCASSAAAASTWKHLGSNPFYRPSLKSQADLRSLVRDRGRDLKTGFAAAGYPELYPAFMEQFPTATIDSVTIAPGDTFTWIVFKRKGSGRVAVLKDTTWTGTVAFDAYRFTIDQDGKRHEFVVPYACGNVALRGVVPIPPKPVAVVAAPAPAPLPAPPPPAPVPQTVQARVAPPLVVVAPPPPPAPVPVAPKPAPVPPVSAPVAPPPFVPPVPVPVPGPRGRLLLDAGLSRQPDPADYVFARVGYEQPLSRKVYVMGLVGGFLRWQGKTGGSALTADLLLDFHWLDRFSAGFGAGFWTGHDGQVDLLGNIGYRLIGGPDDRNLSLFIETRLPVDELDDPVAFGRFGLGLRFRI